MRKTLFILLLATIVAGCKRQAPPIKPLAGTPVILISIDTLRADHLPVYGYASVKTPAIDALAKDSIIFENAYSHVPMTLPSHVSILTGRLPAESGVRNNVGYTFNASNIPSIPSLLKAEGYATGAAVSAYVLRGDTGLRGAFDDYDDHIDFQSGIALGDLERSGDETARVAERWIASHESQPFFYFFHIFEPHAPYEGAERFRALYAPYDAEIATADEIVGRFLAFLKQRGIYDRALIVLLSDHGEGLGDHGEQEHGIFLYREDIHVPLMLKLPHAARAGERFAAPVALIDVLPTVAALTGMKTPGDLHGKSLLAPAPARNVFSETMFPWIHLGMSDLRSLSGNRYQYIEAPRPELYDFVKDPREQHNVVADERRTSSALRTEIAAYPRNLNAPGAVSQEEQRRLAALGYIGSASSSNADRSKRDPKDSIADLEQMRDASRLEASGNLRGAIEAYERVLQRNPEYLDALAKLADLLEKTGNDPAAADAYRRILRLQPEMAGETALSLGNILLKLDDLNGAEEHARLALTINPGAAHLLLGRVALNRKQYDVAEREARVAMDSPYRLAAQVLAAQAMSRTGHARLGEALELLNATKREQAEKHLQPIVLLEFARGDVLAKLGRADEAVAAFHEETKTFPFDRGAWASLAAVEYLRGNRAEAIRVIDRMLAANNDARARNLAAWTFERLGDEQLAARYRGRA